jgi:hypothetical protein
MDAVHVHHDSHVPHVQEQAHGEGHEAHQIDQHEHKVVLDAFRMAWSVQGAVNVHYDPHVTHVQG